MQRALLVVVALLPALGGCFWGESDAHLFFRVSDANQDLFQNLQFPSDRADAWTAMFEARAPLCGEPGDGAECQRTGLVDLKLIQRTSRVRGLITQKGDLQITSHLSVGDAFAELAGDDWDTLGYLASEDYVYGVAGSGCASDAGDDRSGVGRCLLSEFRDNAAAYEGLDEDLRLIMLINLPGEDDIRSTGCDDAPRSFESADWEYPATLRVNYNAHGPVEVGDGALAYGDPEVDPPLPQCQVEVFAAVELGTEPFNADWYGQDGDPTDFTLDQVNDPCEGDDCPDPILGTLILEELSLPDEGGKGRARGRYQIAFTSVSFAARDGKVVVLGEFDTEVRRDQAGLDEPQRQLDLDEGDAESL